MDVSQSTPHRRDRSSTARPAAMIVAMIAAVVFLASTLPAHAQPASLPGDMKAHLARHKAVQDMVNEARESLETRKIAAPADQGVVNYFLTQLDLMEALAQNAFDLSFLFYDRILASEQSGKILAGYTGQRLTLLADELFALAHTFRTRLDAVPSLRNLPGLAGVVPAVEQFTEATGAHGDDILSRGQ